MHNHICHAQLMHRRNSYYTKSCVPNGMFSWVDSEQHFSGKKPTALLSHTYTDCACTNKLKMGYTSTAISTAPNLYGLKRIVQRKPDLGPWKVLSRESCRAPQPSPVSMPPAKEQKMSKRTENAENNEVAGSRSGDLCLVTWPQLTTEQTQVHWRFSGFWPAH